MAAIDDTISRVGLHGMGSGDACANKAQDSGHGHGTAAELACTHVPRAPEAQERQQGWAILSRAAPLTECAQLGEALAADHVLGFEKVQCGRGAQSAGPSSGSKNGARPSRRSRPARRSFFSFRDSIEMILFFWVVDLVQMRKAHAAGGVLRNTGKL